MAPIPCSVCAHDDVHSIDQAIVNGKALAQIARQFGFRDPKTIARHRDRHLKPAVQAAAEHLRDARHGSLVADRLARLDEAVDEVLRRAREGEEVRYDLPDGESVTRTVFDERTILAAVREGRQNAMALAELMGEVPGDRESAEAARRALDDEGTRRLAAELEERVGGAE